MKVQALAIAALALSALAGCVALPRILDAPALRKKNFRGDVIPAVYGVQIAFYAVLGCALLRALGLGSPRVTGLYALVIAGMAALGLLDDLFGSRDTGGFRGHFKKMLLEGKLTTGAVKAVGGGALALAVAACVSHSRLDWLLNALLIALSANALNLVDLRPGRALAAFAFGLLAVVAITAGRISGALPLAALTLPAAALARSDAQGRAMMGDTGSNVFGGALGLALALDGSLAARIGAAALLLGLHAFCERHSLTELVERHETLRKIDALLGVR